jgi:hypothetical protein
MNALTIAFDTTVVGALALPWVFLLLHVFFLEEQSRCEAAARWIRKQQLTVPAGVLLFALTYTIGSVVERVAQQFFNDDDMYVRVGCRMFRFGDTEDRILTSVYCDRSWGDSDLVVAGAGNPSLESKITSFECERNNTCRNDQRMPRSTRRQEYRHACRSAQAADPADATGQQPVNFCSQTRSWYVSADMEWDDDAFNRTAADLFFLQEADLLLKGQDATERLRQLHDQIMVLRGAAFNAIVGFWLCLFALGVCARREQPESWLRWVLTAGSPLPLLALAVIAYVHHMHDSFGADPPYLEFSLLLIGLGGAMLLWRKTASAGKQPPRRSPSGGVAGWSVPRWGGLTLLSAALMAAFVLGWWATEVMYAQEVIYHYDSQWPTTAPATTAPATGNSSTTPAK